MATFVAVVMALAIAGAFWLVWENRASSEVVGAAIPVAIAAFSALGLVFAFGNPEPIERSFPVRFVMQQADLHPIMIPHRPFPNLTLSEFGKAIKENPDLLRDPSFNDLGGGPLFHHYLQKAIVDWISLYHSRHWRSRTEKYDVGGEMQMFGGAPDAAAYAVKQLSADDVKAALGANRFAGHKAFMSQGLLAVPPGTTFSVTPPDHDKQQGETSEVRFENRFVELSIRTVASTKMVGLDAYGLFLPIPQEEAQKLFSTVMFIVRIEGTFNKLRKGHPDMQVHREWVSGIVDGLAYAFDEERLLKKTTESYLLWQQAPDHVRNTKLPMGPIR